jgi:hypothetical protein
MLLVLLFTKVERGVRIMLFVNNKQSKLQSATVIEPMAAISLL